MQQTLSVNTTPPTFADIVQMLPNLPAIDATSSSDTKAWLACAQHRPEAQLLRPKLALFCATHGAAQIDSSKLLAPFQDGSAPALATVEDGDFELQLYDLTAAPVADSCHGPALTETAAAAAIGYGMTVAAQGFDLLMLSTIGDSMTGADKAAGAVIAALLKNESDDPAIIANRAYLTDPLTIAATLGGHDICVMIGAIIAARMAKLPVLVEGLPAIAAALTLAKLGRGDMLAHVRATSLPDNYASEIGKIILALPVIARPAGDGQQCVSALQMFQAV